MADTTTTLTTGTGDRMAVETRPTTLLDARDAALLCVYRDWLERMGLMETLGCRACWTESGEKPSAGLMRGRTEAGVGQIGLMCPHHVWFFEGDLPPREAPSAIVLANQPRVDGADLVTLSSSDAALLQAYRALLLRHGWIEALDCYKCWADGVPAGTRAYVTDTRIAIMCRHRTIRYPAEFHRPGPSLLKNTQKP